MLVDYNRVAPRYDANPIRRQNGVDPEADPARFSHPRRMLDLGCGTGNYLAEQVAAYGSDGICGVDASEGMLAVARGKVPPGCELRHGRAEAIPYGDSTFDYLTTRFAFHHFADKAKALDEMVRVLKPGGRLRIFNIVPELSPGWWLYRYFPGTVAEDQKRFWTFERIRAGLAERGFEGALKTWPAGKMAFSLAVAEARNRETSQLLLIDDGEYERGLAALAADLARAPGAVVDPGITLGEIVAYRS